jgi:hypothetical protein
LAPTLVDEVEQFFINHNKMRAACFKPFRRDGPEQAMKMIKRGKTKAAKKKW